MSVTKMADISVVFPSSLGWMALITSGRILKRLCFGHASREAAVATLDTALCETVQLETSNSPLVRRLQAYALGARDDFRDVEIDLELQTGFQRRVVRRCRQIPYGKTLSYGELAAQAGSPGAARAVGSCMAANRVPLVVPCHRVVTSAGRLGGYSATGGIATKQHLLDLEAGKLDQ